MPLLGSEMKKRIAAASAQQAKKQGGGKNPPYRATGSTLLHKGTPARRR